jgi:Na+/glutamate symporter
MAEFINKKDLLKLSQNSREEGIASFHSQKDLVGAASAIYGSIDSCILGDQLRYLDIKRAKNLANEKTSDNSQDADKDLDNQVREGTELDSDTDSKINESLVIY